MATTFNDLSDAELGRLLRSRFDRLCQAHAAGISDEHPSESWARDTETLKAYREAAATGGIAGKVAGTDNPPPTPGTPKPPAQDSQLGTWVRGLDHAIRFVPHGGQRLVGDVDVAMPGSAPVNTARRMEKLIPGYGRRK
jgi:hypothetical protein